MKLWTWIQSLKPNLNVLKRIHRLKTVLDYPQTKLQDFYSKHNIYQAQNPKWNAQMPAGLQYYFISVKISG